MKQVSENYIPQDLAQFFRRQARRVWLISMLVTLGWVLLILVPPIAEYFGWQIISTPLYKAFGVICHQIPERSFHILAHKFGVCSRCFGVYFGLLAGFLIYPFLRPVDVIEPFARYWLFGAMIPIGIDWALGMFGIWENTFASRFITGAILGAACAIFMIPALVEIFRLTTGKRAQKRLSS